MNPRWQLPWVTPGWTLVQKIAEERGGRYLTLDDEAVLAAVRADPSSVIRTDAPMTVIDEAQRAPELSSAIFPR